MKKYWILFLLLTVVITGCQQKTTAKPDDGQMQQKDSAQTLKDADKVSDRGDASKIESIDSKDSSKKGSLRPGEVIHGMFQDVLFDYDKYDVKESFQPTLRSVALWMTDNSPSRLSIEGHCDERGTNEYNLALGDRRARAVRDYLVSLGVPSSRLDLISYGEEKPLCGEQTEDCWAKNRRAHFVVLVKASR
jgi:peptidoglycan-associated lipoprotein